MNLDIVDIFFVLYTIYYYLNLTIYIRVVYSLGSGCVYAQLLIEIKGDLATIANSTQLRTACTHARASKEGVRFAPPSWS